MGKKMLLKTYALHQTLGSLVLFKTHCDWLKFTGDLILDKTFHDWLKYSGQIMGEIQCCKTMFVK